MPTKKAKSQERVTKAEPEQEAPPQQESVWEWIVAGIGFFLVAGIVGVLLYDSVQPKLPPAVIVQAQAIRTVPGGYLVEFRATNAGGYGAAGVTIQGELLTGEEAVETSDASLSYLAAGSDAAGGLYFERDPSQFQLKLRALGYQEP